ncbi:hypothetical protein NXS08_04495 [Gleimia sp. 6138-11-ORH1]|uniref:hypothetical protein n=1 Tax=Gleimia sp. 6138-11-ORH1 TaxID=2973937 RepID=UPI002167EF95|nr:hypothetical protein [Gleimia sp. 6138-11-ORH1]MCS4484738.1 hypothetical protein [Gleimia sp. 6138-11-ORH1]
MVEFLEKSQLQTRLEQFNQLAGKLRFAEGLRRNAELVRAETNLHLAKDIAFSEGVRLDLAQLRADSLQAEADVKSVEMQIGYNYWRLQLWVSQFWPPLNPRREKSGGVLAVVGKAPAAQPLALPAFLGTAHKLAVAQLPLDKTEVGIPLSRHFQEFAFVGKIAEVPLFWRLGLQLAQALQAPIFTTANLPVVLTFIRQQLVISGLEPTGCLQFGVGWNRYFPQVQEIVNLLKSEAGKALEPKLAFNSEEVVVAWLSLWADILLASFPATEDLIKAVQAGRMPETL